MTELLGAPPIALPEGTAPAEPVAETPQPTEVEATPELEDYGKGRNWGGTLFSNSDAMLEDATIDKLMEDSKLYGQHNTRLKWWGFVYYDQEAKKWRETVKESGDVQGNYEADTPEDLIKIVNDIYGWE